MVRCILVAMDGSPHGEAAASLAIGWGSRYGAELVALGILVMGAHGHHPLRDLFFTSVTRAVLQAAPVPVFVEA